MFKVASAKYQIVFLGVLVVNIACSELGDLGILEETDVDDISTKQPAPDGCTYHCTLPTTPYSPLCGSDGKTYGNICHLNTFNSCHHTHISRISGGTCPNQHCVFDPHPLTCSCPCNLRCSNISRPVCGTNGVTYQNACQLARRTACFGYHVRVCHTGRCP